MSLITVGFVYRFSFVTKFSSLDGVYEVVKIYAFDELLKDNKNLFDLLYAPLHLTSEEYNRDVEQYRYDRILKLVSVENQDVVVYAPESIMNEFPVYTVSRRSKLVLAINLGIYDDADSQTLESLKSQILQYMSTSYGVAETPGVFSIKSVYLTDLEYEQVVAARKQIATKVLNWFSENKKLQEIIADLQGKITMYESYIKKLLGA